MCFQRYLGQVNHFSSQMSKTQPLCTNELFKICFMLYLITVITNLQKTNEISYIEEPLNLPFFRTKKLIFFYKD